MSVNLQRVLVNHPIRIQVVMSRTSRSGSVAIKCSMSIRTPLIWTTLTMTTNLAPGWRIDIILN